MQGNAPIPANPPRIPGIPENAHFYVLSDFEGLNTRVDRPSIGDQQLAWLENMMPIDKGQCRALPDVGPGIYTATGVTISNHGWYTLSDGVPRLLVFLSDGSAVAINKNTLTPTTVAGAGTIVGTAEPPHFAQYGNQYVCIVTDQTNGYFIYDGTNLYLAGTVSPSAQINDGGAGYTSSPTVTVHTSGAGTGAAFSAAVANGSVISLTCTTPGSGFAVGDLVYVTFSGGGAGTSPQAHATLSDGVITNTVVTNPGNGGYHDTNGLPTPPAVNISDPTGTGATIQAVVQGGYLTDLKITNGGSGYSSPTLSIVGGNGANAAGIVTTSDGVVTGVTLDNAGSGLVGGITAAMLDAAGSGAQFDVETHGGSVTNIVISNGGLTGGSGYAKTPIVFSGGGLASAALSLMPVEVNGTDIETYGSRIWISGGSGTGGLHQHALVFFTAPESATDFSASSGGGVFPSTDSFLVSQYTGIKQALGFLYLLGDSSCNYISGVQESGTPPTTTFSNLNVDPTIGTVWASSLVVYGTTTMFANVYGVHAIIGGSVTKVSEPMDGLFYTAPSLSGFTPSSALHTLYGKHIYLFNYKIVDPYTGATKNTIMCWDGHKWWLYTPSVSIQGLSTLEFNSTITAYGTDGASVYPLLASPSGIAKTLRSKLYTQPSIAMQKKAWGFYALFGAYQTTGPVSFSVSIDTEGGSNALTFNTINGTPTGSLSVIWAKSAGSTGSGYAMGYTMTSTSNDFVIYETMLVAQDYALRT